MIHIWGEISLVSESASAGIEWVTVFEVLLGAVVGFLSTGVTNWLVKKLQIRKLTKKIRLEVEGSLKGLKTIQEDVSNSYTLDSPIWDVLPASASLLDLPAEKYIKMVTIYTEVKKYNQEETADQALLAQGKLLDEHKVLERRTRLIRIIEENKF